MTDYRILVTGNDENNKSHIVLNTPIDVENYFTYQPGFGVEVFWQTSVNTTVGEPFKKKPGINLRYCLSLQQHHQ